MSLKRKSIVNFIGGIVPVVASILTVPVIVAHLGDTQYGLFTLVTAIVGYFALIDINVTAGSVKYLAEHHARGETNQVNQVISFGGFIYLLIGLIGGVCIFIFADTLVTSFFNIPTNLHEVASNTLRVAAFAFFFGQMQVYLSSIPQALQRYDLSSMFESVFGALTSISTVLVVLFGGGLVEIVVVRLLLSILNCGLLLNMIRKILPSAKMAYPDKDTINRLFSFSAYSYLSRIATVTYTNGDKLLLGVFLDMRAISLYSVPFLLANRVFGLIFRLGQVIFPAASALDANNQHIELERIYFTSTRYYIYLNASLSLLLSVFSRELLHYWAGSVFGSGAALVLVLIATAAFFDSLTNLPSLVNDGLGKPKNTGVIALARAVVGLVLSYFGIRYAGYIGAAWAHLIVSAFFAILFLVYVHGRSIPVLLSKLYWRAYHPTLLPLFAVMAISAIFSNRLVLPLFWFISCSIVCVTLLAMYAWYVICLPYHRTALLKYVMLRLGPSNGDDKT
jgi:O-antigen/teichoic acid export membrane protein